MKSNVIQSIADLSDRLPTLPGVAVSLLKAIQKKETNLAEIGGLLSKDAALTAKILKLVNSSFFSLPSRVTTVDHAIRLLGLNAVKNIALSFSLISGFQPKGVRSVNLDWLWRDSLIGAVAAKLLAAKINLASAEDAFFLGLLQDIGSLALACSLPEEYPAVQSETGRQASRYPEVETRLFGVNHMEVGEYLTRSWGLPESFYIPIGAHHSPQDLQEKNKEHVPRARLLHLSTLCIDVFNAPDLNPLIGAIDHLLEEYGFDSRCDAASLVAEIHLQTQDVLPIFEIQLKDDRDYAGLLDRAKAEMAKLSLEMIAELQQKDKQIESLKDQTTLDGMTSIRNYKGFCEALSLEMSRAQRYARPLALILCDLDHFKAVNDSFGHQVGDHALRAVAAILKKGLRATDHLARYGGEEFAIILPETDTEGAFQTAERLRERIESQRIAYKDKSIRLTMSFGVASLSPGQGISSEELIGMADDAMYRAKRQGRNLCCTLGQDLPALG